MDDTPVTPTCRPRTVLVTGSSSGIGRAIALRFAADGAALILHYAHGREAALKTAADARAAGAASVEIICAVLGGESNSCAKAAAAFVAEAIAASGGHIDVAVLNAGIYAVVPPVGPDAASYGAFCDVLQDTLSLNLAVPAQLGFLIGRHMAGGMAAGTEPPPPAPLSPPRACGAIVMLGSADARRGDGAAWAYCASKAGLHSLAQCMAIALGGYGIVVTAVAPGFVATSANLQTLAGPDGAAIKGASSWGRVALPEEVAEVVAFAAAWNRCAAISGAVLDPPVPAEAAAVEILWFYAAGQIERRGPVTAGEIARLFAVGDIDGLTLVWTPGMPEWAPVCEVPPLKAALQEVTAVDEVAAGTDSGVGDGEYGEQSAANANASRDAAPSARQATDSDVSAPTAAARRRYRPAAVQAAAAHCVYVSGMPPDVTVAEVAAHFRAAGLLAHEPDENAPGGERPRVRLYTNADSSLKGDGTVAYIRPESVSLAVTLLDEAPLRAGGAPLHVEPATWGHKDSGSGDGKQQAQRRPKKKNPPAGGAQSAASKLPRVKDLERQAALSWAEEDAEPSNGGLRVVLLRNLFEPGELDEQGQAELVDDVAPEAASVGVVEKLTLFPHHAAGVIMIKYKSPGAAIAALALFNGRYFGGRRIVAEFWDGKEDFGDRVAATPEEEAQRIDDFGRWLEEGDP